MNNKKLKIGFVFDDSLDSADGVAQYVKTIGSWLSSQGHEVRYLVGQTLIDSWAGGKVYSLSKNYRVRFNGNFLSIPGPANKKKIKQVLFDEQFDVLHVQVPYSPLLAAKIIKNAQKEVGVIGTFHIFPAGFLSRAGSRLLRLWLARTLKRFNKIVAVSSASANFAKAAYKINADTLPNAVDTSRFVQPGVASRSGIVFLGRLVERKGCRELISAFEVVHKKNPDAKLIIAGDGPQRAKLEKIVKSAKLENHVSFEGFVSEERKAQLLASAQIACFPSLYGEAFGIVLIEAMASGAGVVLGGNNPGYSSVLGSLPESLFNPKNKQELADKILEFLSDEPKAEALHQKQQELVKQYDVNVVGAKLLATYTQAIADQRALRA